jgi:Protein of unknown function (DUF3467)
MGEPADDLPEVELQVDVPAEAETGVYADFASLWYTRDTFVIDFVVARAPVQVVSDADGEARAVSPGRVVARVRIPPAQVFDIASKLTQALTAWEEQTGRRPSSDLDGRSPPT